MELFFSHVHLHGGPARYDGSCGPDGPGLERTDPPGKVFDLELPLDQAADGYRAMDTWQAIKVLLRP
jgi:hypothetical protein